MKSRCPFSGVIWNARIQANDISDINDVMDNIFTTCPHPIFSLSEAKLQVLAHRAVRQQLGQTDSILTFLALLKSTNLVIFYTNAEVTYTTAMKHLDSVINILGAISHASSATIETFPRFAVDKESASLETIDAWAAEILYSERRSVNRTDNDYAARSTTAWERLANGVYATPKERASLIAKYVSKIMSLDAVANSLRAMVPNPIRHNAPTTLTNYWLDIIRADGLSILSVPDDDINDLEFYLLDRIPLGTAQSKFILDHIRGLKQNKNLVDEFASIILRPSVTNSAADAIMSMEIEEIDSLEDIPGDNAVNKDKTNAANQRATIQSAITNAPTSEPKRTDFADLASFLRAKAAYHLAKSAASSSTTLS